MFPIVLRHLCGTRSKTQNLPSPSQVVHLFLSSLLIGSVLMKTILSFNATKILFAGADPGFFYKGVATGICLSLNFF